MITGLYPGIGQVFYLYPNPADHILCFSGSGPMGAFSIYKVNGPLVRKINPVNRSIDISDLSPGVYMVVSEAGDQKMIREKLIIR